MTKDAVLGLMKDRVKTDMRLPYALSVRVREMANLIGVPQNAVYAMGAAYFCVLLSSMMSPGKKRGQLLRELREFLQKVLSEAEKAA